MPWPSKIILIGMPGAGKSTFGKKLAKDVGLPFFDLDELIEAGSGQTIPEIFEKGEDRFRIIEKDVLIEFLNSNDSFVLSAGGGTPCFYDNLNLMLQSSIVVYLKREVDELVQRLSGSESNRPL